MDICNKIQSFQDKLEAIFSEKKLYPALFLGFFVLESLLSLWTGNQYDLGVWFNTGIWLDQGINIYLPPNHIGYPPLWALWCGVSYKLYLFFGLNFTFWTFMIKLPITFGHLVLAYVVGKFAEQHFEKKTSSRIFFFMLTWSFFFFIGSIWGQINTLSALLTFLAFDSVIKNKTSRGTLFLGLAIALKIYPLVTLPAFIVFALKNYGKRDVLKLLVGASSIPVFITVIVFSVFQWDILYFLRTVFYTTPVFESNPAQITIGCMNFWSYIGLLDIDISLQWPFRLLWLPLLGIAFIYWIKKEYVGNRDFTLSIISFYLLFMATYGWVSEQLFLDILPFLFILILGYSFKRVNVYMLIVLQFLIYVFTIANRSLLIFSPLIWKIYPVLGTYLDYFHLDNALMLWAIRGYSGLAVSVFMLIFLITLLRPKIWQSIFNMFHRLRGLVISRFNLKK